MGPGEGVGSQGKGVSKPVAVDGATEELVPKVAGTEKAVQLVKRLPVTRVESEEDLQSFLAAAGSERLVLVDFGAEWCKNCKAILVSERAHPQQYSRVAKLAPRLMFLLRVFFFMGRYVQCTLLNAGFCGAFIDHAVRLR